MTESTIVAEHSTVLADRTLTGSDCLKHPVQTLSRVYCKDCELQSDREESTHCTSSKYTSTSSAVTGPRPGPSGPGDQDTPTIYCRDRSRKNRTGERKLLLLLLLLFIIIVVVQRAASSCMSTHVVLCSTCGFKMFLLCVGDLREQTRCFFYKIKSEHFLRRKRQLLHRNIEKYCCFCLHFISYEGRRNCAHIPPQAPCLFHTVVVETLWLASCRLLTVWCWYLLAERVHQQLSQASLFTLWLLLGGGLEMIK